MRPALICAVVLGIGVAACDGSLAVIGEVEVPSKNGLECEVSLWAIRGPLFGEKRPSKLRATEVRGKFSLHWTISGPAGPHWIEVSCPGFKPYRSDEFKAPQAEPNIDLGLIELQEIG